MYALPMTETSGDIDAVKSVLARQRARILHLLYKAEDLLAMGSKQTSMACC
jgi:hypothetical protein